MDKLRLRRLKALARVSDAERIGCLRYPFDLSEAQREMPAKSRFGVVARQYQRALSLVVNANANTSVPESNIRRDGLYALRAYRRRDARNNYLLRTGIDLIPSTCT